MGAFDLKYAAYEKAMQQNNYFSLRGDAIGEQFGRYAQGLQYDEIKAEKKRAGREFARQLAEERKALSAAEQNSLSSGLTGEQKATQPAPVTIDRTTVNSGNEVKVAEKMKVGTAKTGFKFYIIDEQGQVYQVDRKAYNAVKKGKMASIADATLLDTKKDKIPEKIKKASTKAAEKFRTKQIQVPKHNYNIITDPQAYRAQQADMYEKLWGNFSHPSNTPLGTAEPTPSGEPKTWAKYFKEHGKAYTQPVSGVVEAERRAADIMKRNEITHQVEETLKQKTEFNPANLEKWSGHSPNPTLNAMNDYYRELEKQPTIQSVTDKLDDVKKTVASQNKAIDELGKKLAQQGDKIDDLSKTIVKQQDEMSVLTKKLAKTNKKVAVIATLTALAAGAVGYLLGKSGNETEQETVDATPAVTVVQEEQQAEDNSAAPVRESEQELENPAADVVGDSIPTSTAVSDSTLVVSADSLVVSPVDVAASEAVTAHSEEEIHLELNEKGEYRTKAGDSFWDIAERFLKDVYADEPENFENLPKTKRDAMIQKECERIMRQNGYWYDENHNLPEPMLYQNIKVVLSDEKCAA